MLFLLVLLLRNDRLLIRSAQVFHERIYRVLEVDREAVDRLAHFEQAIILLLLGALGAFLVARFHHVDDLFHVEQVFQPDHLEFFCRVRSPRCLRQPGLEMVQLPSSPVH